MTRKVFDNCILICACVALSVYLISGFSKMTLGVFYILIAIALTRRAYRAELKRKEKNEGYELSLFKKIASFTTPVSIIIYAAGCLVLGVFIFLGVL